MTEQVLVTLLRAVAMGALHQSRGKGQADIAIVIDNCTEGESSKGFKLWFFPAQQEIMDDDGFEFTLCP
jgi:hypothetical protein